MSDLQDALDFVENDAVLAVILATSHSLELVVEAARNYANPDYKAAKAAFDRTWNRPEVGGTEGVDGLGISLKAAIDAALGVTEDTHQFRPMEDGGGECAVCNMGIGHESHWKPAPQKGQAGYSAWLENDGTATPVTEDERGVYDRTEVQDDLRRIADRLETLEDV